MTYNVSSGTLNPAHSLTVAMNGAQEVREMQVIDEKRRRFVQLLVQQNTVCRPPVINVSTSWLVYQRIYIVCQIYLPIRFITITILHQYQGVFWFRFLLNVPWI